MIPETKIHERRESGGKKVYAGIPVEKLPAEEKRKKSQIVISTIKYRILLWLVNLQKFISLNLNCKN